MIPQALIAMLACTRIGAIHSVVFSAFSADALKARIKDGKAKILITSDGYYRKGKPENLIDKAKQAAQKINDEHSYLAKLFFRRIADEPKYNFTFRSQLAQLY